MTAYTTNSLLAVIILGAFAAFALYTLIHVITHKED
jgi:hypothetical protein